MKKLSLAVSSRENAGSRWAKRLRREGNVPAVLYGKSGNRLLSVNERLFSQLRKEMAGSAALVEITDNDKKQTLTLIQAVHQDALSRAFLNIDFKEVDPNSEVHFSLIVHTKGEAPGVKNEGGVLDVLCHELQVKARPEAMPEFLDIDVSTLNLGDTLCVRDLPKIEGLTIVNDPDQVVVACVGTSAGKAESGEEAAAEGEEAKA